jgi:hypothetical protein
LVQFINEFAHPRQILCARKNTPSEESKNTHKEKIADWETKFTEPMYRAAMIAAKNKQRQNPQNQ